MKPPPDWIADHQAKYQAKPALRFYYQEVFAGRLRRELLPGKTLELGSGPGFLSRIVDQVVTSDIGAFPGVQTVCDAHCLPFADGEFTGVFCLDVLHHLRSPLECFREIARVLRPGGRFVLIEPYTTPLSRLFYKYFHHEDCALPADPWRAAFPPGKEAMAGNAELPRACLVDRNGPVTGAEPDSGLRLRKIELFAGPSYLLTGGFQSWQFPLPLVKWLYQIEEKTAPLWTPLAAARCLAVLERPLTR